MKKLIAVLLALSCMLIGAAAVAETLNVAYMPNYGSLWAVETAINRPISRRSFLRPKATQEEQES